MNRAGIVLEHAINDYAKSLSIPEVPREEVIAAGGAELATFAAVSRPGPWENLGHTAHEHLQVAEELPRRPSGEIRNEILQLVAMNQLDLIDPLIASDRERAVIRGILA